MPQVSTVQSIKFYNQLVNGETFAANLALFTTYLQGNVGGKYKAVIDVTTSWYSLSSAGDPFRLRASNKRLIRTSGSWLDEGFANGDTIWIESQLHGADFTVNFISPLEIGLVEAVSDELDSTMIVVGRSSLTECKFKYGLVENNGEIEFISRIDGNNQTYTGKSLTATLASLSAVGTAKTWQNGNVEVKTSTAYSEYYTNYDGTTTENFNGTAKSFVIEHEFEIAPLYLEVEEDNITTTLPPENLEADNSLKYVFDFVGATSLNDPNSYHGANVGDILGNVGYLNENFNGGVPDYTLNSIAYTNTADAVVVDGVQLSGNTTVTAVLTGVNFTVGDAFVLRHQILPLEDSYRGSSVFANDMEYNFGIESVRGVFETPTAGTILTNIVTVVDSTTQVTLTFDINVSTLGTRVTEEIDFLLSILLADESLAALSNNEVHLKLGSGLYSKGQFGDDTDGLITFGTLKFYQHIDDYTVDAGQSQLETYVEDKVLTEFDFTLDWSGTNQPFINSIKPKLVVYNSVTGAHSVLQQSSYDLSVYPLLATSGVGGGKQQMINLSTERAFKLLDGDDFKKVECVFSSGALDTAIYDFRWAFAFDWEDYKLLQNSLNEFYDSGELNNGLNLDASHYSENIADWGVYVFYDIDISKDGAGTDSTIYREISPEVVVFDYDTYTNDPNTWTVVKKLTNQGGTDTNLSILDTENTKVFFEFTSSLGDVGSVYEGIVKLEEYRNGGLESIASLSTKDTSALNNVLVPLSGDSFAKITKLPSNVLTLECEIDKSKVIAGKQYHISGRIFTTPLPSTGKQFQDGFSFEFQDGLLYEFEN